MCILITTLSPGLVSSENGSVAEERADSTRNIGGKWRNGWVASLAPPGRGEGGKDLMEDIETGPPPRRLIGASKMLTR